MLRHKIVCYGDSNTYGYDPRGFMGMRYPKQARWTWLLQETLSDEYAVVDEGMNGRMLPQLPREKRVVESIVSGLSEDDLLVVMLGTNDILLTDHPDASVSVRKMERFLQWYKESSADYSLLVLGPVYLFPGDVAMKTFYDQSLFMNEEFERLCRESRVHYVNAGEWDIPLSFDAVHFSEEGHASFARHLTEIIAAFFSMPQGEENL